MAIVRRNQFNITPQCIVHKPTDAAFIPYAGGDPYSGITRLGQLGSESHNNGKGFRPEDVRELWTEYVTGNPQLFKPAELRSADPGAEAQAGTA